MNESHNVFNDHDSRSEHTHRRQPGPDYDGALGTLCQRFGTDCAAILQRISPGNYTLRAAAGGLDDEATLLSLLDYLPEMEVDLPAVGLGVCRIPIPHYGIGVAVAPQKVLQHTVERGLGPLSHHLADTLCAETGPDLTRM